MMPAAKGLEADLEHPQASDPVAAHSQVLSLATSCPITGGAKRRPRPHHTSTASARRLGANWWSSTTASALELDADLITLSTERYCSALDVGPHERGDEAG